MKILIVDDSLNKLSDVSKVLIDTGKKVEIKTVEDIQGALAFLIENSVDFLILDLFLPFRKGKNEKILPNGGSFLLNEINRKKDSIILPKYIIGLSQYHDQSTNFSDIWQVIEYSPSHTKWSNTLKSYVLHIEKILSQQDDNKENSRIVPTLYVEGLTDVDILTRVVELHFPNYKDKFSIVSQKNAGANWVAQQLIIWGHQLNRDANDKLIKAIGLFDSDEAGIKAKKDVNNKLTSLNQLESIKTNNILPKYSMNLLEYYKRGLKIEIEIESLLPTEFLIYADKKGWLEYRAPLFIEPPKDLDQMSETVPEFLERIEFPNDLSIYLKKVKLSKKEKFAKEIIIQSKHTPSLLDNFKTLISDVISSFQFTNN